jgi:hypothetical protein
LDYYPTVEELTAVRDCMINANNNSAPFNTVTNFKEKFKVWLTYHWQGGTRSTAQMAGSLNSSNLIHRMFFNYFIGDVVRDGLSELHGENTLNIDDYLKVGRTATQEQLVTTSNTFSGNVGTTYDNFSVNTQTLDGDLSLESSRFFSTNEANEGFAYKLGTSFSRKFQYAFSGKLADATARASNILKANTEVDPENNIVRLTWQEVASCYKIENPVFGVSTYADSTLDIINNRADYIALEECLAQVTSRLDSLDFF